MIVELNEVYIGKAPVASLQEQLSVIRNKFRDRAHLEQNVNTDPEVLKFNRLVESVFGYGSFALYIHPTNIMNAGAWPISIYFTDEEKKKIYNAVRSNPSGFKYRSVTPGISLIMELNVGIINSDLTDEEIMAVLLHEFGHSFFEAITDNELVYDGARCARGLALIKNLITLTKNRINSRIKLTGDLIYNDLQKLGKSLNNVKYLFTKKNKSFSESMMDNMRASRFDYTNEKFADTFAAMYGYGPELHSAFIKFDKYYNKFLPPEKHSKLIQKLLLLMTRYDDFVAYTSNLQDEHPGDLARMKTGLDYLTRELANESLDPKIKREIIQQAKDIQNCIDEYMKFAYQDDDSLRTYHLYQNFLYKKFGGDRREQDTDNNALFDTIDSRYEEIKDNG